MECTGEKLLNVVADLQVEIGNVNENIIKGWFDTNDDDLLKLLSWMCTLSKENYISPQELEEYLAISKPFDAAELETELVNVEQSYSGLLNVEKTLFELNLLESEIEAEEEEEKRLQYSLKTSKKLKTFLDTQKYEKSLKHFETANELDEAFEDCYHLAQTVDRLHYELFDTITKLDANYENGLLEHITLEKLEEIFNKLVNLKITLPIFLQLHSIDMDQLYENMDLHSKETMKNLGSKKYQLCLEKLKSDVLQKTEEYLDTLNVSSPDTDTEYMDSYVSNAHFYVDEDLATLTAEIESDKLELYELKQELESLYLEKAKYEFIHSILKDYKNHADVYEFYAFIMGDIGKELMNLVGLLLVLKEMCPIELKLLKPRLTICQSIDQHIKEYVKDCTERTEYMNRMIVKYKEYRQKPLRDRLSMFRGIMSVFKEENLNVFFQNLTKTLDQIKELKQNKFVNDPINCLKELETYRYNVLMKLRKRLASGPTSIITIVSHNLYWCIMEATTDVRIERKECKSAQGMLIEKMKKMNSSKNKWKKLRRHLWMLFLTNPEEMKRTLSNIKQEGVAIKAHGSENTAESTSIDLINNYSISTSYQFNSTALSNTAIISTPMSLGNSSSFIATNYSSFRATETATSTPFLRNEAPQIKRSVFLDEANDL